MSDGKDLALVVRQLLSLTRRPHFYGTLVVKFQDSAPVYSSVTENHRAHEIPQAELPSAEETSAIVAGLLSAEGTR